MVTRLLRLPTAPTPADAPDALALAICHLWRGAATNPIEQAAATGRARQDAAPARKTRAATPTPPGRADPARSEPPSATRGGAGTRGDWS